MQTDLRVCGGRLGSRPAFTDDQLTLVDADQLVRHDVIECQCALYGYRHFRGYITAVEVRHEFGSFRRNPVDGGKAFFPQFIDPLVHFIHLLR